MSENKKVVLVGTGFVGMSMAYSFLNQGGIDEIVLIDIDFEKARGEAMDLAHGLPYSPKKMAIKAGDYSECKNADVVVITAGMQSRADQTRLELLEVNAKIVKGITEEVVKSGFNGIFVVASNPVDLMTYVVEKVSKFDKSKVIGSGTILDTARLRYILAKKLNISSKNVHTYIMGEHGDSSFVPWTHCYVGCKSLLELYKEKGYKEDELNNIHEKVRTSGYDIIARKKATYYGIGMSLTRLVKAILDDENAILTVSTKLEGEYENEGLFIGVPAIINRNGVKEILNLKLTKDEQKKFNNSADIIKRLIVETVDKVV